MNNMTTNETLKFLELYQAENCLWNPKNKNHKNKNVVNDSWQRISDTMDIPVHELKKKKDNLLTTFRINFRKRNTSIRSSAGADEVFQPTWIFYNVMAEFLTDVYESASLKNSEGKTPPDFYEEASTSNGGVSDILMELKNDDQDEDDILATPQKRRAKDPLELQASRKMSTAFTALNTTNEPSSQEQEDDCDLFCRMLAKKIKEFPRPEREEIMYELHGVMMTRRRRFNTMQM